MNLLYRSNTKIWLAVHNVYKPTLKSNVFGWQIYMLISYIRCQILYYKENYINLLYKFTIQLLFSPNSVTQEKCWYQLQLLTMFEQ